MTDGDKPRRFWLHTALLKAPDGTLSPAFVIDERAYPDPAAARAALNEAFDALQRDGVAAEFEAVIVRPGEPTSPLPAWREYLANGIDAGRRAPARSGGSLRVSLTGALDRDRLNSLQDALGMRRGGRLDDDSFDRQFGYRVLSEDGDSWTAMRLHRKAARAWQVTVSSHQGATSSAEQVESWRDQIVAAATAAGLAVGEITMSGE